MTLRFCDIEQNTNDWYEARLGLITGSKFGVVMASTDKKVSAKNAYDDAAVNYAAQMLELKLITEAQLKKIYKALEKEINLDIDFSATAKDYAFQLATERLTGAAATKDGYTSKHMRDGHVEESEAKLLFSKKTGLNITNGGFWCDNWVGVSPDGMTENGVVEVKSHLPHIHFKNIKRGTYDPSYKWQMRGNMHFTGSKEITYISYSKLFYGPKRIFSYTLKYEDHEKEIDFLLKRIEQFKKLIIEYMSIIEG